MASPVQVYWNFATTAARNAQVVLPVEVGCWCMVYETGHLHQAVAGGSGASCWSIASTEAIEDASDVGNDSSVAGTSVADALDTLSSTDGIANDSSVAGTTASDALDTLGGLATKNASSASAPGVTDDADAGYKVTSLWVKSTGEIYICVDATAGAAVWTELDPKD